jgi:hypothetical protein
MEPEIEKYRKDLTKKDSLVFRKCVDFVKPDGKKLTNQEIGGVVVCLMYVSSNNTAMGAAASILDLATSKEWWDKVSKEGAKHIKNEDLNKLFKSKILENCAVESARRTTHIFPLNRKPLDPNFTVGDYYMGDVDVVAICEPMLMLYDYGEEVFSSPSTYNPGRFDPPMNEKKTSMQIMTWGSGVHLCPGRGFELYEIIAALAMITTNFRKLELDLSTDRGLDYFSPSVFARRYVKIKFTPLTKKEKEDLYTESSDDIQKIPMQYNEKNFNVELIENKAWVIREFIDYKEQENLYQYTINLSKGQEEQKQMLKDPSDKKYPLTYYNLIYTNTSNCEYPKKWFDLACEIWDFMKQNQNTLHFENSPNLTFNSLYAELLHSNVEMKHRKDQYTNWGIYINLGASCDFLFENHTVTLHSGDIFITDFSKYEYAIRQTHELIIPKWFTNCYAIFETFDRTRCSVQIKDVSDCTSPKMSMEEFKNLIYT